MRARLNVLVIAAALLGSTPVLAADNLYCTVSGSFYPTAITCPVPWVRVTVPGIASPQQAQQLAQLVQCKVADRDIRLVTAAQCPGEIARAQARAQATVAPAAQVPPPPPPPVDNTIVCDVAVETAKDVFAMHTERMTYEQCQAERAREQAAAAAKETADKRKEAERARTFKNAAGQPFALYPEELAQANRDAATRGFKEMSFEDFKLDGAELGRGHEQASIAGVYQKFGNIEYLFPNSGYVMQLMTTDNVGAGIVLVTDDTPRDIRKYFLECPDDLLPSSRGCPVTVLGHGLICTLNTLVGPTKVPCLAVDDGWHVIDRQ